MDGSRHIDKRHERCEMYGASNRILVIDLNSSDYEAAGSSQSKRRKVKRRLLELMPSHSRSAPVMSQQTSDESDLESTRVLAPSRLVTPTSMSNHIQANETQASAVRYNNFYSWLIQTVILDDLSFREPFINPAWDANQLTEEDLILHGAKLYLNAHLLSPQELVNLPFIPRQMVTGETLLDLPFLDPLLVVLWDIHIDDVQWMLNVLPWRVVDRPVRTGRSILAWIAGIGNIHQFLESTRTPLSVKVKIFRFLDNYFE